MESNSRVRVYIACSFDGFIAGPNDDLSWLPGAVGNAVPQADRSTMDHGDDTGAAVGFEDFMADVGALLMGRRTYDVIEGFAGLWPYGDRPVLVATHGTLAPSLPTVRPVAGDIAALVASAKEAAGEKDVYIDGGELIRQALDADLIDEMIVTMVPILLGHGHALFAGVAKRQPLEFDSWRRFGDTMLQVRIRPTRHG